MFRNLTLTATAAFALSVGAAHAAGEGHVHDYAFSFEGPFGSFDQLQLQRGLQVYTESCAGCHGLQYVSFRNLSDEGGPGLPDDQMRAYAEQFFMLDFDAPANRDLIDPETGDQKVFSPADHFPANTTQNAPDLSLMAKARAGFHGPYGTGLAQLFKGMGGAEYIACLMMGYEDEPDCALDANMDGYYNSTFTAGGYPDSCKIFDDEGVEIGRMVPGSWIGMAPPLFDDQFDFADGAPNDMESVSQDVAAFLMWTAEPKMMARKQAGLTGVIFLTVLSVLLYLTNKRLWAPHKKAAKEAIKGKE